MKLLEKLFNSWKRPFPENRWKNYRWLCKVITSCVSIDQFNCSKKLLTLSYSRNLITESDYEYLFTIIECEIAILEKANEYYRNLPAQHI